MLKSKLFSRAVEAARCSILREVNKSTLQCESERTFLNLYNEWTVRFTHAKIPEPSESSGYIVAHLLGYKTFSCVPNKDLIRHASDKERSLFHMMCHQRLKRMPIQYILGDWDFSGINLKMRPPVFIPRPETEMMVDKLSDEIRHRLHGGLRVKVLEIGCGTGAISLSLLNAHKSDSVGFVAIDAADHAVNLTNENLEHLSLSNAQSKISVFQHAIGFDSDEILENLGPFNCIVSNPPYVPTCDMKSLPSEISRYEDPCALHGGYSGLDVIMSIIEVSDKLLTQDGVIWLEVDCCHPDLIKTSLKDWTVDRYYDMYGSSRFCRLSKR